MKKYGILLILCLTLNTVIAANVVDYQPFFARVGPREITLRQINYSNHTTRYLVLNTSDFSTRIVRRIPRKTAKVVSVEELADTSAYFAIRKQILDNPNQYKSGVGRFERVQGIVLSGDLCPSSRGKLEQTVIDYLAKSKKSTIYICISGRWIDRHHDELNKLRNEPINIVWVNHSMNHRYENKENPNDDFLCLPNTDLKAEILDMEQKMFELEMTPSPFFRYPGLISSPMVANYVLSLGLIPLGAEAWLAKDEEPRQGSVVLIHLNGNEPKGIRLFFEKNNKYPIQPIH